MRHGLWMVLVGCGPTVSGSPKDTATTESGTTPTTTERSASIEVTPLQIDFGDVPVGCTSDRVGVVVHNAGDESLEIFDVEMRENGAGVFRHVYDTPVLAAGESYEFEVDFTPAQPTAYDGAYLRVLSDDYDIWKVDIPLTGAGAPDERIEEIFEQVDPGSVDLLLVLDDGSSMSDKIEELADVASTLVTSFEAAGVDYHIAVVSSDMTDVARSGRFLGEVLSADHDDPASALKAQIDLAAGGPGNHGHFDAVMAALDEPLVSGPNAGFLREDSRLTVLAYADSDDRTGTATPFSTWLNSLTADPELSQFASVSGPTSGFLPCFSIWSGDSVEPAPALGNAVGATGGYHQDICEVDAAGIVDQVAVEAAGLTRDFPLSNEVTQPDWIEVTVDGLDVAQSSGNGFTYVDALNAVRFHGSAVPLPGAEVVVAYPSPVPCD